MSDTPNVQLGVLLEPWLSDEGVHIVGEVLSHRVEGGSTSFTYQDDVLLAEPEPSA